jgi:molecular chaperone GrpE (heat shock protein)
MEDVREDTLEITVRELRSEINDLRESQEASFAKFDLMIERAGAVIQEIEREGIGSIIKEMMTSRRRRG